VRQPSRLLLGPLIRSIPALVRFPRLGTFILLMLPAGLMEKIGGKSIYHVAGYELFERDRPLQAWLCLQRCLQVGGRSTTDQYLLAAMCLYHGLGRFRDAMALLAQANEAGAKEVAALGLAELPFRVLDSVWARHIGHIAELDHVIKLGILEGRRREDTILYLPPGSLIANRFLLEQVATQLRLIETAADLPFDASAVQALHYNLRAPRLPDQTTAYFWEVAGKTYMRWHRDGRSPLFRLPLDTEARGWAALHQAGMPQGAWFVTLHVREGKWNGRNAGMSGIRNAEISTYFPAIAEIAHRGGWVVRIGDPEMTPMPQLQNVIDYCHSEIRSDWMDVFLLASCRFMIGTNSGPALVPALYGVPTVFTNWWPPAERPWHPSDLIMTKMLRRQADGRYLTMSEMLREPFSYCLSLGYLSNNEGVFVEDNNAELIRAAVAEMLARREAESSEDAEAAELRLRADKIYQSHGVVGMSELPREFLRRHSDLIA
jgi:putative glycosyltransferase (TIGR04372 family)